MGTIFMSFYEAASYLLLAFGSLLSANAQSSANGCPSLQGKSPLEDVDLFDGPPSERADLMADISRGTKHNVYASWDVGYIFDKGAQLFLVCHYTGMREPLTVKVEKRVQRCIYRTHPGVQPAELRCR
jgi:hypothetical protein